MPVRTSAALCADARRSSKLKSSRSRNRGISGKPSNAGTLVSEQLHVASCFRTCKVVVPQPPMLRREKSISTTRHPSLPRPSPTPPPASEHLVDHFADAQSGERVEQCRQAQC
ncbi:hypothetical protein BAUCODRAFT_422881 [Baudoinia panamericana UAMH 10762]|uniref:Uncharacterized protein n=1 Tax=Baudoinia panamericana (strain UAMH 10762) TaxID=717646 RepID=M2LUT1_BAUPA|nr:uncharacterized protein BAUCODRAFT_422881 [Baudoinia panamericana UAMH 10762]EMC98367.1 hypothetical protein BAUCODRAFT_422881 [Baudoinia panamericana UAMH 10762]